MPRTFTVPLELDGLRLDQALAAIIQGMSRRKARELLALGSVYLEGHRCRVASRAVRAGATIALEDSSPRPVAHAEVRILWQNDDILALDKPSGVAVAPTRSAVEGTLLHALGRKLCVSPAHLFLVHRLDTPTSGVVLVAGSREAAAHLSRQIREGRVKKTYLAWVLGRPEPPAGEWTWPLSPAEGGIVRIDPSGRPARSLYRTLEVRGEWSLLELHPFTGRTHQLRVHCARAGTPILGDRKYGGRASSLAPRALLHASRIEFARPGGAVQIVEAPLPEDMILTHSPPDSR
jgi:23S rRNA pseudouridine1911/1915/1917 synthase